MGALEFESRANAIRGGDPGGARRPSRGGIRDKPIHNVSEVPFSRGSLASYMAVSCGSVPTRQATTRSLLRFALRCSRCTWLGSFKTAIVTAQPDEPCPPQVTFKLRRPFLFGLASHRS